MAEIISEIVLLFDKIAKYPVSIAKYLVYMIFDPNFRTYSLIMAPGFFF